MSNFSCVATADTPQRHCFFSNQIADEEDLEGINFYPDESMYWEKLNDNAEST